MTPKQSRKNPDKTMTKNDKSENNSEIPEDPDLGKLASEYMDLWQKQLSSMASDKDIAALMAQGVSLMNTGAASMSNMANMATTTKMANKDDRDDRSPTSCPACGITEHVIDDLHQRIKQLEGRIADLESSSKDGRK
jgi:hypothetical protein